MISAAIEIAVSSGVRAPMSRPMRGADPRELLLSDSGFPQARDAIGVGVSAPIAPM